MKALVTTCVALILALACSTAANCYWIRAYYSKDPFVLKFQIECRNR